MKVMVVKKITSVTSRKDGDCDDAESNIGDDISKSESDDGRRFTRDEARKKNLYVDYFGTKNKYQMQYKCEREI